MNKIALLNILKGSFKDSEIQEICLELEVDYENLSGMSKADKARELIIHLYHRKRLQELEKVCQRMRPILFDSEQNSLSDGTGIAAKANDLSQEPRATIIKHKGALSKYRYDVSLSFAGEDREIAERLANALRTKGIRVFYDKFEKDVLWGKNLYEYLTHIYKENSRYTVLLLSKHYAEKPWTMLERQSAQARAIKEAQEYILPIRLDNTEIPGLPETVGYVSLADTTIEQIVDLILKKLGKL